MKLFIAAAVLSLPVYAAEYKLDKAHTQVGFEVDHLAISSVTGRFDRFDGKIVMGKDNRLEKIEGIVQAASINTNEPKRDKHLRSPDFFDTDKYPRIQLVLADMDLREGRKARVTGTLMIKNVAKDVKFNVDYRGIQKDPWGGENMAVRLTAEINRKDFGLKWNQALETGGLLVGEKVKITVDVAGTEVQMKKPLASGKPKAQTATGTEKRQN